LKVNKRHWDAIAKSARYRREKAGILKRMRDNNAYLEKLEPKLNPYLTHIKGKRIIVPQFGDGLVMLACAKKGAIVTGVDLSDEQVRHARKAAEYCGVKIDLVEADWQNLPESMPNAPFDMVVTECGIFIWIKNLDAWMKNAYRLLKNGGMLVVPDFHPVSMILESKEGRVTLRKSYFDQEPEVCRQEPDLSPSIEFLWKLSDVINSGIQVGFRVNRLEEFYVDEPNGIPLIPNNFLLVATKE
jgi:2-polyprenyl-3-methyl-5-hydroxy-6-metoxy-1,4-benzoquinol methylase